MSINWPAPCWLHHMERSGCNSWDRPEHSARELERRAAGDILICAAMCKGMHLQPGSVPVIRPASVFLEEGRSRKTWGNETRPRKCYWLSNMNCLNIMMWQPDSITTKISEMCHQIQVARPFGWQQILHNWFKAPLLSISLHYTWIKSLCANLQGLIVSNPERASAYTAIPLSSTDRFSVFELIIWLLH